MRRQELVGYIGVDIGGQSTRVGTFDERGRLKVISFKTEPDFKTECERIAEAARQLLPKGIKRLAVGSPGPLDWRKRYLYDTPNLPWQNVSFAQLEKLVGCEVLLDNDAMWLVWAKRLWGRGRARGS
jgi:Transcriptional regulator/sugar kinase